MSLEVSVVEEVSIVGELSLGTGYSKDALNRVLFKWFSEELVEVSRVESESDRLAVYVKSRVLSVSELRAFWLDFRKEIGGTGRVEDVSGSSESVD